MKVYCFVTSEWQNGEVAAVAVCGECGKSIGGHYSSNVAWSKRDMMGGFPSKIEAYKLHGETEHGETQLDIEWVDDPDNNAELARLLSA